MINDKKFQILKSEINEKNSNGRRYIISNNQLSNNQLQYLIINMGLKVNQINGKNIITW